MTLPICAMIKSRYIGDGHPTFSRNPYNWYIKPYYRVDDHPLLYGNNGSLDPSTYGKWVVCLLAMNNSGRVATCKKYLGKLFFGNSAFLEK